MDESDILRKYIVNFKEILFLIIYLKKILTKITLRKCDYIYFLEILFFKKFELHIVINIRKRYRIMWKHKNLKFEKSNKKWYN